MLKPYDASKPLHAVLSYNSQWETVDGINLWAEIKGKNLKTFELGDPEAVIIGARMDTFGVVPGLVRSERLTSNLALISQIAVDLSKQPDLNRSFFLVLYGSSYNCYDGLRNFYFPYYKRNAKTTPTLDDYLDGYKVELNDVLEQIDAIEHNPVRQDEDL